MAGKAGMRHANPAPTPARQSLQPDDIGDPAKGEKVPRCVICGLPSTPANPLIPCNVGYIRRNVGMDFCERCLLVAERRQDARLRMEADPLTVWEEIA